MTDLLTVSAVAKILNIPESTVRSLENRGEIIALRDSNGRRLFEREAVEAFAKGRRREAKKADRRAKSQAACETLGKTGTGTL
jgi:excisionase family DNA binding protein